MKVRFPLFDLWVWRMAWRDSRSHRRRLGLYLMSIVLGVAVLVAIRSMGDNMEAAVSGQAKTLLGADLRIRGSRPFGTETQALIDSMGGEQAQEVEFNSMIYFPQNGGTRLVEVRAMAGGFPFYGDLVTEPMDVAGKYQDAGTMLLDAGLMLQFGVEVGDSVRLGAQTFQVGGRVLKIPGENFAAMTLAPRVFLPLSRLEETGLVQRGSRVEYHVYFKFEEGYALGPLLKAIQPHLEANGLRHDTVASRQGRMGRTLGNLYNFLGLVGFVALLLGCVGVASAVHVYVRQKLSTIAVLRCLGARAGQAFSIYLIQAAALGMGGSVLGALVGLLVQALLPGMLREVLPVEVHAEVSWPAVLEGVLIGMGLTLLFALLPLLPIRRVSPLRALRSAYGEMGRRWDVLQGIVILAIVLLVGALAVLQTGRFRVGVGFTVGLGVAFGLLLGMAALLMKLVRRYFPSSWRYVWRQGLANLYRPNNQTRVLMLSLGLGTFLISTLYLSQHSLMEQVSLAGSGDRSNLVMFD
ncbi:MAG: ABC transporter permease, partial [bacterium]|nr:ABC transporter permease [bacterium]